MSNQYDPVESLQKEVIRFQNTNRFNPMEVTNFYVQAACVLIELNRSRQEVERLKDENRRIKNAVTSYIYDLKGSAIDYFTQQHVVVDDNCGFCKPTTP